MGIFSEWRNKIKEDDPGREERKTEGQLGGDDLTAEEDPVPAEFPEGEPPADEPPMDEPSMDEPPMDEPPMDEPPMDEPPMDEPPMAEPPMDEPSADEPPEGPPPMTKEEQKELRRRMKRTVRGFRIRSFGMDGVALIGFAVSALMALFLGWTMSACIVGPAVSVVVIILELGSWFSASRETKKIHPDTDVNGPWREKVWHTGVRTMRILVVLTAAEAALPFICVTAFQTVTWQRWLMFGIGFAVMAVLLLMALHGPVREIGYRRDILEDSVEDREERKHRRHTAFLWRLIALVLIVLTAFGQTALNRRDWKTMASGQVFTEYSEFREYVESEPTASEDESSSQNETSETSQEAEEAELRDAKGNVIYRFTVRNSDVAAFEGIPDETGNNFSEFIVYTKADREKACWSLETANLVFFGIYAAEMLVCYVAFRRVWRKKRDKCREK